MKNDEKLVVTVNTKLTKADAKMLADEAKRRGYKSVAPFLRDLILSSAALPNTTTLILETLLRFEFAMLEIAKETAEKGPLPAVRIQKIREHVEKAGGSLVSNFMFKRAQEAKLEGDRQGS